MIACKLSDLYDRCGERGYSIEEVRGCIVSESGESIVVDETHPAYPHPRPGLGDMVASALSAVGITKERVSAAIGKPCGCDQRQEALNDIGRKFGIG